MKTVTRTLVVKAVGYDFPVAAKDKEWEVPRVEDEIKKIMKNAPTLRGRHYPWIREDGIIKHGIQCLFINTFRDLGDNQGIIFEVCSYVKGHIPEAAQPDLESNQAIVKPAPIKDEEGNSKELVYTYRCLAFGQVVVIESVQGAGGIAYLQRLLRSLIKRYSHKGHGALKFIDVASSDLRALIKSRGGIKAMRASILHQVSDGSKYSAKIGDLHRSIKGTNKCVVEWSASDKDSLDIDEALEVLSEVDDLGLNGVSISFNEGGKVADSTGFTDLSQYRECKPVKIQVMRDGRPAITEIESELVRYINSLRDPQNEGPINSDGTLKNVKPLGV